MRWRTCLLLTGQPVACQLAHRGPARITRQEDHIIESALPVLTP